MIPEPDDALIVQRVPVSAAPPPVRGIPAAGATRKPVTEQRDQGEVPPQPPEQIGLSVIRSKVQPPPVRDSTLERPRLLDWLSQHTEDRVKVIAAEAGYGKTTLLADYAQRTQTRCLWYRLETSDRDWVTFINYLIAAVREVEPSFGNATAGLLAQIAALNPTLEIVVGSLITELEGVASAPTMLILDDFHLVEDGEDVYKILGRLFEWSPLSFTFLISSRRSPELRLARLAAAGEVAQLTTDHLRFSHEETTQLFAVAYGHPLEPDLLGEVEARTEGWGASLQLVYSSIRSRPPADIRIFINSLSGAEGSLYDYLAEEVLSGLPPVLQRTLIHASLLDRVVPGLVLAILSVYGDPPSGDDVMTWIEKADDLGLMGRSSAGSTSRRFHPLLREFLVRQLETSTTLDLRREMHRRIARVAEPTDWLVACHHYIEAGAHTEAMRVLNDSATAALGKGAWGPVGELLNRMEDLEPPPAVQVVRARGMIAAGNPEGATAVLADLDVENASHLDRAVIRLAMAHSLWNSGDPAGVHEQITALREDEGTPEPIREIGEVWAAMVGAIAGGSVAPAIDALIALGRRQVAAGHHYFAGISLHNAMTFELARGGFETAIRIGNQALAQFSLVPGNVAEAGSTNATLATCAWELGHRDLAMSLSRDAAQVSGAHADAYAEMAYVAAIMGESDRAEALLREAKTALAHSPNDLGTTVAVACSEAMVALTDGRPEAAARALANGVPDFSTDVEARIKLLFLRSCVDAVLGQPGAVSEAERGLDLTRRQRAARMEPRLEMVRAAASGDSDALRHAISTCRGSLGLLEAADIIAPAMPLWDPVPPALLSSIDSSPQRWLPVLRRQVASGNAPAARAAARLLATHGRLSDAPLLVAFERMYVRSPRARVLGRSLVRRTSPRLHIEDLGRIRYRAGDREVSLSDTRRKAASVLTFLITRPNLTATKEQVLDELWPDLDPASAANSLNQTLYFLRRDIDPWYTDGISADYIVNESELLWLDSELVRVASVEFHKSATEILSDGRQVKDGPNLVRQYDGRFAPEFEYEEWAIGWRDRLHALYLHLVHASAQALSESGQLEEALNVLLEATSTDPEALELETQLVQAYARLGAQGAAARQYRHFAEAYRREVGADPPALIELLRLPPGSPKG